MTELLILVAQVADGEVARDRRLLAEVALTLVVDVAEEDTTDVGESQTAVVLKMEVVDAE